MSTILLSFISIRNIWAVILPQSQTYIILLIQQPYFKNRIRSQIPDLTLFQFNNSAKVINIELINSSTRQIKSQLSIIDRSKKFRTIRKSQSSHSCSHQQLQQHRKYGPPIIKKYKINETMGFNLPNRPFGLKKHLRTGSTNINEEPRQSYLNLTLKVGELSFFKRFRNNRYLDSFSSKKNMFNICEEKVISKLHQELSNINQESRLLVLAKKLRTKS